MKNPPQEQDPGTVPEDEEHRTRKPYEKPRMQEYQPLEEAGQVYIYYTSEIFY